MKRSHNKQKLESQLDNQIDQDFEQMVISSFIPKCPVTLKEITNTRLIFGPDISGLREEKLRRNPDIIEIYWVFIPRNYPRLHNYLTLVAVMMFINEVPFLVILYHSIKYVTVQHV